jgi:uncharacterized membrane protein YhaH (DUF805 family)
MFFLFNCIVAFVVGLIDGFLGVITNTHQVLGNAYQLAVFIPSLAVGVRRMHDTDHSGWWLLVPFVNLVFAVREGTPGEDKFGSNPNQFANQ